MTLPYESATSGKNAVEEMQKILRAFGASSFVYMDDFANNKVIVQFAIRDRRIVVEASAKGYAVAWMKHHPYTSRTRGTKQVYEAKALKIGQTAVYSILRDWIKGQVTAVEVGMLSLEGAFLGQIMLKNGQTVLDHVSSQGLLQITSGP